ncbi:MAG: hypothetical protein V1718_04565 [archaeon]
MEYRKETGDMTVGVCLETAHPAKFPTDVVKIMGVEPEVPDSLRALDDKEEFVEYLGGGYEEFKSLLLKRVL